MYDEPFDSSSAGEIAVVATLQSNSQDNYSQLRLRPSEEQGGDVAGFDAALQV